MPSIERERKRSLGTRLLAEQEGENPVADLVAGRLGRLREQKPEQKIQFLGLSRTWAICSTVHREH